MVIPTEILWEWNGNGNENSLPTVTLQHIRSQTQSFTAISFKLGNSETCDNKNIIDFASIGKTPFIVTIRICNIIVIIITVPTTLYYSGYILIIVTNITSIITTNMTINILFRSTFVVKLKGPILRQLATTHPRVVGLINSEAIQRPSLDMRKFPRVSP